MRPADARSKTETLPLNRRRAPPHCNACVEATVRFAAELGYNVTVIKDGAADHSDEEMHAALDIDMLNYASAIVTTDEIVDLISPVQTLGISAQ
jgi:ureidoacrylate peracid hydrolase